MTKFFILLGGMLLFTLQGYCLVVTGPYYVCDDHTELYTLEGYSLNCNSTVDWEVLPPELGEIVEDLGYAVRVRFNYTSSANTGSVKATISYSGEDCPNSENAATSFKIYGFDEIGSINGPEILYQGTQYNKIAYHIADIADDDEEVYNWYVSGGDATIDHSNGRYTYINTSDCNGFTITCVVSHNECGLQVETALQVVKNDVDPNIFQIAGWDMLCKYPLGTHTANYNVINSECVTYNWFAQSHQQNPLERGVEDPISSGYKKLEIIGSSTGNNVSVRATGEGDTKLFVRITSSNGNFLKEYPIYICEDVPEKPSEISHPYTHCTYTNEDYSVLEQDNVGNYSWTIEQPAHIFPYTNSYIADCWSFSAGNYLVTVKAINACGYSATRTTNTIIEDCLKTGINDPEEDIIDKLDIYPNPAVHYLNIDLPYLEPQITLSIYNSLGKIVLQQPLNEHRNDINVEHLVEGVYLLHLTGDNYLHKMKLIISEY